MPQVRVLLLDANLEVYPHAVRLHSQSSNPAGGPHIPWPIFA